MQNSKLKIGIVIIGRNEGKRLIHCLESVKRVAQNNTAIVYVDSGSTDGSCEAASELGVEVIELNCNSPFTAARARNTGFQYLHKKFLELKYVQFIDGDCELLPNWLSAASETLDKDPSIVAVCGWRRELFPERSLFNRICDVEWHMGTVGEVGHFGGDVMIRTAALTAVGGYDESVIAAEDDEVSVRLRQSGGKIVRIDQESTLHDANMTTFQQWWQRAIRGGYAFAQVSSMHGAKPERKFVKEVRRIWLWGVFMPISLLVMAPLTQGLSLIGLLRYPLSAVKLTLTTRKQAWSWSHSFAWGFFCSLSAFPNAFGVIRFYWDSFRKAQHKIIEYKGPSTIS